MYKGSQRGCKKEIRFSKREFGKRISHNEKKNPQEFFKYIRGKKNNKDMKVFLHNKSGTGTHNNTDMGLLLNKICRLCVLYR